MRFIDADSAKRTYTKDMFDTEEDFERVNDVLDYEPTVDAVVVTRCKDCEHLVNTTINANGFLICDISDMEIAPDDFCSYGERREE